MSRTAVGPSDNQPSTSRTIEPTPQTVHPAQHLAPTPAPNMAAVQDLTDAEKPSEAEKYLLLLTNRRWKISSLTFKMVEYCYRHKKIIAESQKHQIQEKLGELSFTIEEMASLRMKICKTISDVENAIVNRKAEIQTISANIDGLKQKLRIELDKLLGAQGLAARPLQLRPDPSYPDEESDDDDQSNNHRVVELMEELKRLVDNKQKASLPKFEMLKTMNKQIKKGKESMWLQLELLDRHKKICGEYNRALKWNTDMYDNFKEKSEFQLAHGIDRIRASRKEEAKQHEQFDKQHEMIKKLMETLGKSVKKEVSLEKEHKALLDAYQKEKDYVASLSSMLDDAMKSRVNRHCPRCGILFGRDDQHKPMFLDCGHSICHICAVRKWSRRHTDHRQDGLGFCCYKLTCNKFQTSLPKQNFGLNPSNAQN